MSWTRVAGLIAVTAAAAASPLQAQLRGVLRDSAGAPVPDALVELWGPSHRIASAGSDARGSFWLAGALPCTDCVLQVRRIGFKPLRLPLGRDSSVVITMTALATAVASISVSGRRDSCPTRDQPEARLLYLSAVARYSSQQSAHGVFGAARLYAAVVPPDSLGVIDTTRLIAFYLGGTGYPADRHTFYGHLASGMQPPRFDLWEFPWLESFQASHFVDSSFAQWNRFSLLSATASQSTLAFCSRYQGDPYIQGTLTLAADSSLAEAQWRFIVPRLGEEAGGQVFFAPLRAGAMDAPLLPTSGLFWRRRIRGYYMEWLEYRDWKRCLDGTCAQKAPL